MFDVGSLLGSSLSGGRILSDFLYELKRATQTYGTKRRAPPGTTYPTNIPASNVSQPGKNNLTQMMARKDPLFSIDWTAHVIDNSNIEPIPSVYIEELQIPLIQVDNKPVYRSGYMLNYSGTVSTGNSTIKLYNDRSGRALRFAQSWLNLIHSQSTGNFGLPSEYKKTIRVYIRDTKQQAVYIIDMLGCWPTSINQSQLTGGAAELIPISMDLSVDRIRIDTSTNLDLGSSVLDDPLNQVAINVENVVASLLSSSGV
jgi:hypothetical protein